VKKDSIKMKIDIVIPVYNSESCLLELSKQLSEKLEDISHRIIYVNDNSPDNSWALLKQISKNTNNVIAINLAKNFGQDCAIMAGLSHSDGDYIVIMDDDLQHNPSDILPLIDQLKKKNADLCYGKYEVKKQSLFKNFGSWLNDKLANIVLKKPHDIYLSPFKILKNSLVEKIIQYDGPYPYIDGLIFRYTTNITQVLVSHHKRFSGKSNYSIAKSISVWLRVLTNFSVIPLRISTYIGIFSAIIGFLMGLFFIFLHFMGIGSPEGWPSLIVSILFIGGIQLIALGTIGEYVGRSFLYQNKEPQYIIDEIEKSIE
jgi:undecaprenyl-phosphate 4-deoxy-4-formamido-L-arabinose transferase